MKWETKDVLARQTKDQEVYKEDQAQLDRLAADGYEKYDRLGRPDEGPNGAHLIRFRRPLSDEQQTQNEKNTSPTDSEEN